MDPEDISAVLDTATRFAQKEIAPLLETDERDGDLDGLPRLLERAEAVGLMASPDPEHPGHQYGVWGRAHLEDGPLLSVSLLRILGRVCAGVSACVHFAGLGPAELLGEGTTAAKAVVALFEPQWRMGPSDFKKPPEGLTRLQAEGGGIRLRGCKAFVHAPPGWDTFVVYAAGERGWERVLVRSGEGGLGIARVGEKTGLSALQTIHLDLEGAEVEGGQRLAPQDPTLFLFRYLQGLGAVSIGNGEGAMEQARQYATEGAWGLACFRPQVLHLRRGRGPMDHPVCRPPGEGAGIVDLLPPGFIHDGPFSGASGKEDGATGGGCLGADPGGCLCPG